MYFLTKNNSFFRIFSWQMFFSGFSFFQLFFPFFRIFAIFLINFLHFLEFPHFLIFNHPFWVFLLSRSNFKIFGVFEPVGTLFSLFGCFR